MSIRILWRSTVFVVTLLLIYLAFPVVIVPSSLPAIKAILIEEVAPSPAAPTQQIGYDPEGLPIYQLSIPATLTMSQKITELAKLHQQGLQLIFKR